MHVIRTKSPAVIWTLILIAVAGCAALGPVDTPESLMKEAQALYAAKNYDAAIAKYERVIQMDKTAWMAYLGLARCYIVKGNWIAAITNARSAFGLAPTGPDVLPDFGEALFGGGRDALLNGQFGNAIGYFLEYLRIKPSDPSGYLNAAKAYLGNNAFGDALRMLLDGLRLATGPSQQEFIQTLLAGGTDALAHGNASQAIAFLHEYLQREPNNLTALLNLGKAYWQNGNLMQALNTYRQVLSLSPGNEEAQQFLRGR